MVADLLDYEVTPEREALASERIAASTAISSFSLPELPGDADTVYDRLLHAEQQSSPDLTQTGYRAGTAIEKDELMIAAGENPVLLTAEHATAHRRINPANGRRKWKGPDFGTGALSLVLAEDQDTYLILPIGHQTGDANKDEEHPLKDKIAEVLDTYPISTTLAVHGMPVGLVSGLDDPRAFDIMIGMGSNPGPQTRDQAERIQAIAKEFNLRAGINEPVLWMETATPPTLRLKDDGTVQTRTFAASGKGTTRYFAEAHRAAQGQPLAAVQIELSSFLRVLPIDIERDIRVRQIGSYLGYCFMTRYLSTLSIT